MIKALVAYASRMGGTAEIAVVVGQVLREHGLEVRVLPCDDVDTVEGDDVVVLGSAVYLRRWQHGAVAFLERFGPALAVRQTWLFQSGPCGPARGPADASTGGDLGGDDEEPDADEPDETDAEEGRAPRRVARLAARFGLPDPVTFGGRLDRALATGPVSRWVASGPLAGDRRDWAAIRSWARSCAEVALAAGPRGMSAELGAALGRSAPEGTCS